jgi:hypothetical protein
MDVIKYYASADKNSFVRIVIFISKKNQMDHSS